MSADKNIQFLPLKAMIDDLGYDWTPTEYYIASDAAIAKPQMTTSFRPAFYAIILCVQGWMELRVNGDLIHIGQNNIFGGGPNMIFQRLAQSDDCRVKAIYFTKDFLLQSFGDFHQFESFHFFSLHFKSCVSLTQKETVPLVKLYDILLDKRALVNSTFHTDIIRNLIFAYVYETAIIYQREGRVMTQHLAKDTNISIKFQNLVARHCIHEHRLPFYADQLFVTPKYLIQVIKKITGRTPGALIDEALITAAKIQLNDPSLSIGAIAQRLSFADLASFSKFFKKQVGISPIAFRKTQ